MNRCPGKNKTVLRNNNTNMSKPLSQTEYTGASFSTISRKKNRTQKKGRANKDKLIKLPVTKLGFFFPMKIFVVV